MKVLGIVCSPRKGGNTEIIVEEALTGARDCGAETELLTIRGKDIKPCDSCYSCEKTGKCRIEDDMQEIYLKLMDADGIIWGTPVYFHSVTAQAKILLDRSFVLYRNNKLSSKVGGVISVASSMGHLGVCNLFNSFFTLNHMLVADFVHGYARGRGYIRKDRHAMQAARELGRQVVLLAEKQFKYPEEYQQTIYMHVMEKYGIDMSPAHGRFEE